MKISIIDLIRSAFGKRDEKFRHKLSIFLVCLVISMIIWFTIKLSDEYDTIVQIPVTFTNLPKNKVLTSVSDSTLQVEILEKGSNLLRMLYVDPLQPITINLRFLPVFARGNTYHGYITPAILINEIEREQNLLGKIISITPDTIYLTFEVEKTKKVPVKASLDLTFEKQYMRYGAVKFNPDSVTVKGPHELVAALDSAYLGSINLDQLSQNSSGELKFSKDSLNQNLTFIPDGVTYSIPVEKFTEAEMEVPVRVMNAPGRQVKIFPDKVKIYFTVALKDYPKIEPEMLTAVADFSGVSLTDADRISIKLVSYPSNIRINKIQPEQAEFIIIQ